MLSGSNRDALPLERSGSSTLGHLNVITITVYKMGDEQQEDDIQINNAGYEHS